MSPTLTVNNRRVNLTNLDRVLWPDQNLTKRDLVRYYIDVAPFMLPHLRGRPLVVQRFPGGIDGEGFYQKNIPEGAPRWLRTLQVRRQDNRETIYIIPESVEDLVWLGNQACIELHPWLSSAGTLGNPDYAVFDLDPMENTTYEDICRVALAVREVLSSLGLQSYPKLSGATGIQVYLPLEPVYPYRQVRTFAENVCGQVNRVLPGITTMERKVGKRQGKLYLDYLQNVRGQTLAAPYSPRPLPGAPVSIPLTWEEVAGGRVRPGDYTLTSVLHRLERYGDLFAPVLDQKQKLPLER